MRQVFEGYLPYVLALAWMWAASRVPLRQLVLNSIVGMFLLLLAASAVSPRGEASQTVRVLMLIGVAISFFTHRLDKRGLN